MKKLILLAAALTIIASASFAQDSTDTRRVNRYRSDSTSGATQAYDIRDMVKIKSNDLPQSLQKSLRDSRYQGWEQGTYYRSQASDRYYIEMDREGKKAGYLFGSDGQLVPTTGNPTPEKRPK